jgi:hypothetical protein
MSRSADVYEAVATTVAQAEDPLAEILMLLKLESQRRRRIHRSMAVAVSVLVLGLAVGVFCMLRGPGDAAKSTEEASNASRWLSELAARPLDRGLSSEEEHRLRGYLGSEQSLERRDAVFILARFGRKIDPQTLDAIAFELTENLSRPLRVASAGTAGVEAALRENRIATLQTVARAIWWYCAREHAYPRIHTLEVLAVQPDPEVRLCAVRALTAIPTYVCPARLRKHLEEDTSPIRKEARALLERR